jgi:hypothetical protein
MDKRVERRAAEARFIGITVEALLRPCEIYPVRTASGNGYVWEWSAVERAKKSKRTFDLFFECLDDARANGYEPHFIDDSTTDIEVVPVAAPN